MVHDRCVATIGALNKLGGCDVGSGPFDVSSQQAAALHDIWEAHAGNVRPASALRPEAALRTLLKQGAGYSAAPGGLATYQPGLVSLPHGQASPPDLSDLLEGDALLDYLRFDERIKLPPEARGALYETQEMPGMCGDPILSASDDLYVKFVAELIDCKVCKLTYCPRSRTGAFFVSKKSGKLRLIADARRSNVLFRRPVSKPGGSIEALSRIDLNDNGLLFIAQEDVKDCFFRLGVSRDLGEHFCLRGISVDKLRPLLSKHGLACLDEAVRDRRHEPLDGYDFIFPCFGVMPMGFSWAFHFAQEAHKTICKHALPDVPFLFDRRPLLLWLGRRGWS